jgi:hypothetical protein
VTVPEEVNPTYQQWDIAALPPSLRIRYAWTLKERAFDILDAISRAIEIRYV